ncbi:MAG: 2-oxoacid:acceptor oxidoreductase family protein [Spirochaetota bacterium]
MVKHRKPPAFYDVFTRKGVTPKVTHYCPGCGHGNAHKLIAEVITELGIQNRTIFCSPVGCSVFAYYYFDTCNIQCAHGRAASVATAIRRTLDNAVVISYQGDGDLAGIGMGSIVHAANRGENITIFFINNAIYGMTGGQMAPTTLVGQKTLTTPWGRSSQRDGNPIGMSELLNSLKAPVFIERVTLSSAPNIIKARRAFKKALLNQVQGKGFSFVEVLSPCPVNWKMDPVEARKWMVENLEPVFPVKNFRDVDGEGSVADKSEGQKRMPLLGEKEMLKLFNIEKDIQITPTTNEIEDQLLKIAGFGGQGVMSAGILLANCVIAEGLNSTWLPSYGPEMRGGTAYASVIVSKDAIGSPVVDTPNVLIAMNSPSMDAFEQSVAPGGLIIVNSSMIRSWVRRQDVKAYYLPATDIAKNTGHSATANVVVLSVYIMISKIIDISTLKQVIPLSIKKKNLIDINLKAIDAGLDYYREHPLSK